MDLAPAINELLLQQWELGRAIIACRAVANHPWGISPNPLDRSADRSIGVSGGMGPDWSRNSQQTEEGGWQHIGRVKNPESSVWYMIIDDHGQTRAGVDLSLMWNELIVNKGPTIGIHIAHFCVGR
jgi:hypothetical protein